MFKIQISLKGEFGKEDFSGLDIMSYKKIGSIATLIVKGDKEKAKEVL